MVGMRSHLYFEVAWWDINIEFIRVEKTRIKFRNMTIDAN